MLGLLLVVLALIGSTNLVQFIVLMLMGISLLGYTFVYRISEEFKNKKEFTIFGITLFSSTLKMEFPEYISLFGANFSKTNEWGPVSAMGTESNAEKYVIRCFTGIEKTTLYTSAKYVKAKEKAEQLSQLLKVELVDQIKP